MTTEGAGASTPAHRDQANEDAYLVRDGLGLYVVCDGASEGPAGEVASATATEALEAFLTGLNRDFQKPMVGSFFSREVTSRAVRAAMAAVIEAAATQEAFDGMATTVSMVLAHRDKATICHVGDSRVYLIRHGFLHQLTSDHDLAHVGDSGTEEAYAEVQLTTFSMELIPGDTLLLCSDGAEEVIEDPSMLESVAGLPPDAMAARLVEVAAGRNPDHDATVVVVRVQGEADPGWLWLSSEPQPFGHGHTLATQ